VRLIKSQLKIHRIRCQYKCVIIEWMVHTHMFHAVMHHPVMIGIHVRKFIMHYKVITK